MKRITQVILRNDKQWRQIEGRLSRLSDFTPLMGSKVENDVVYSSVTSVPYASFKIENNKIPHDVEATGFCTHKLDFESLWAAFNNEYYEPAKKDVLIFWTTQHYNRWIFKILSPMSPKMVVFFAKKGTFEKFEDVTWQKQTTLSDILEKLGIEDTVYLAPPLHRKK